MRHLLTVTILSGVFAFGLTANASQNSKDSLTVQVITSNTQITKESKAFDGSYLNSKAAAKNANTSETVKGQKNCSKHVSNTASCTMHCK